MEHERTNAAASGRARRWLAAILGGVALSTMALAPAPAQAMRVTSSFGAPGYTLVPRTIAENTASGLRIGPDGRPTVYRAPGYAGTQSVWAISRIQRLEGGNWVGTIGLPGYQSTSAWFVSLSPGVASGTMTYQFEYPSGIKWDVFHYPGSFTRGYRYRIVWEFTWQVGTTVVGFQQVVPSIADDGRCATRFSVYYVPCAVYTDGSVMV